MNSSNIALREEVAEIKADVKWLRQIIIWIGGALITINIAVLTKILLR